ncbi:DMT family transporter [Curvibacter sp. CHRR-16]|uniref:DMT family transporter n=1 Tax=Curvibacter sp. CHRR-16 TaxID=2835872 RepID=UPI001BD978A4|nr:DMT family transporter [Curvibacter sp. CHRR-16]MBT0571597.1 DMT family transporter [Curvibacter sp. CHRR-16]
MGIAQAATKNIASGTTLGILMAAVGAIAFSGKAIIVKLAYQHGVDAVTLIMLRMVFALPCFTALVWWAHRQARRRGQVLAALTRKDWLGVLWLGFTGYYLASFLDFAGLQFISASLERLVLYLNPTLVLVLGALFWGRRIAPAAWVGMALSYAGVVLVFGHEVSFKGDNVWLGMLLVLGSAISYALYLGYSGQLVQRLGSLRLAGLATSVACLLCLLQFVLLRPLGSLAAIPSAVWGLSVLNATVCTVLPVLLVMLAIERVGAGLAAQMGMIGPMSTLFLSAWLLGEALTPWVLAGTTLVLLGVFVVSRKG